MKTPLLLLGIVTALVVDRPVSAEPPATVEKAASVLDLAAFSLPPGGEVPKPRLTEGLYLGTTPRRLAGLTYEAKGSVVDAFAFVKKALTELGWLEQPGGYSSDQAASGSFQKQEFRVSVSAFPASRPGSASVTILNHGDVDTKALPTPAGSTVLYETPVVTAYLAPKSVEATAAELRDLLAAKGWQPYGNAGDVQFFKQNAVKLSARVTSAPAQAGKTVIAFSTELMSADLPAPAETIRAHYADSTKELSFDTDSDQNAIVDFYRQALAKAEWKPTTQAPVKERFGETLFFLNPRKDLLTLNIQTIDGVRRVKLGHKSAAEVEEMLKVAQTRAKPADAPKPKPVVAVELPGGARDVETASGGIEFKVDAGKGKASAQAVLSTLKRDGWKEQVAVLEEPAGSVSLKKGDHVLTLSYVDAGFGDAEVTIDGVGVTVARKK